MAAFRHGTGDEAAGSRPGSETRDAKSKTPQTHEQVRVRFLDAQGEIGPAVLTPKVIKSDEEWRALLSEEQYRITRRQDTERPFCGLFNDHKESGVYFCVCCDLPLFSAGAKFQSGTGWPSFFRPIAEENIGTRGDRSYGMIRTEILCRRCDAHLGHVFDDGPPPTGLRYCLNSASLTFRPSGELARGE